MGCCASEQAGPTEKPGQATAISKTPAALGQKSEPKAEVAVDRKKLYAKNPKIILGYWKIRGLAHPIRYLLEYIEHPYEDVLYE